MIIKDLQLKAPDHLYLSRFKEATDAEKKKMLETTDFDLIAKLSYHNADIDLFCQRPELSDSWKQLWSTYGLILCAQQGLDPILLNAQPASNAFNLVKGVYFYYMSQQVAIKYKTDFLHTEMEYLKLALKYNSIYALKRYNDFLYSEIPTATDKEKVFVQIIENSKKMLLESGSYGYMVLAEALGAYALWLLEDHQFDKAEKIVLSAYTSLDYADSILVKSQYSIHNASLGRGLTCSNSMGLDNPKEAKNLLQKKFKELQASIIVHSSKDIGRSP